MSLTDKFLNGTAFALVQMLIPSEIDTCSECRVFFVYVLAAVCGGAALAGMISVCSLAPFKVGERWRDRRRRQAAQVSQQVAAQAVATAPGYSSVSAGAVAAVAEAESETQEEEPTERSPLLGSKR